MRFSHRRSLCRAATAAALAATLSGSALQAAEFTLMPSPQTVHVGFFLASLKPVLTIKSGDIVTIETATHLDPASSTSPA